MELRFLMSFRILPIKAIVFHTRLLPFLDLNKNKLAQYTKKVGYHRIGGKMVMMGRRKLEGNKVWSANVSAGKCLL